MRTASAERAKPDELSRRARFLATTHRNRIIVYNFCLVLAAIFKITGNLDVSWTVIALFSLATNLANLPIGLLLTRGRENLFGVPVLWFAMTLDVVFITSGIYLTGGSQSAWYTWYLANAAAAGLVAGRIAMGVVMVANAAAYLGLIVLTEDANPAVLETAVERLLLIYGPAFFSFLAVGEIRARRLKISQLRKLEAKRARQLQESEGRYRQLFEDAVVGHLVIDPKDTRVADLNVAAAVLLGRPAESIQGRTADELDLPWLKEVVDRALVERAEGSAMTTIGLNTDRSGERQLEIRCQRLAVGHRVQALATIVDVTDRTRLEQERALRVRLESLGTLAGGIAHDFNNALVEVLGSVSLARVKVKDNPADKDLQAAEQGLKKATNLTSKLLSFAPGGSPVKTEVDIGSLIKESIRHVFATSVNPISVRVADGLWPVNGDRSQLAHTLDNLLINARDATEEGDTVTVTAENAEICDPLGLSLAPGRYVSIRIEDTGCGIPVDIKERIFDPYFTTRNNGSGLGLTVAHTIVRNHGGALTIDSADGGGTTAEVFLPANPGLQDSASAPPSESSESSGLNIIVMDDEERVRETLIRMLEALGNHAHATADGEQAVRDYVDARRRGAPFDGLIMDLTVPNGMGGKEAIEELRRHDQSVRAIVSSGYSSDPVLADFSAHGFCGVLRKPFTLEELRRELGNLRNPNRTIHD